MYDIGNRKSFVCLKDWIKRLGGAGPNKIGRIIVGNKSDLPEKEKEVHKEERDNFMKEINIDIMEASAKNNKNVKEAFISLIDKMLQLGLGKNKQVDQRTNSINYIMRKKNNNINGKRNCC